MGDFVFMGFLSKSVFAGFISRGMCLHRTRCDYILFELGWVAARRRVAAPESHATAGYEELSYDAFVA
jgi:hypothetical protein